MLRPAGSGSETCTFVASAVPLLTTASVYITWPPGGTVFADDGILEIARSAGHLPGVSIARKRAMPVELLSRTARRPRERREVVAAAAELSIVAVVPQATCGTTVLKHICAGSPRHETDSPVPLTPAGSVTCSSVTTAVMTSVGALFEIVEMSMVAGSLYGSFMFVKPGIGSAFAS